MSLEIDDQQNDRSWGSIGLILLGLLVLVGAAAAYYYLIYQRPVTPPPETYNYTITQRPDTSVDYLSSSFFGDGPGTANSAYISDLTESINSTFNYTYTASRAEDLTYTHEVTATVRALFVTKSGDAEANSEPTVWSERYQLLAPVTQQREMSEFTLSPTVRVPFADCKKQVDQLNTALELSLTSDVVVTSTVVVRGTINDMPFKDSRATTITVPLTQQLFALDTNYDEKITSAVGPSTRRPAWDLTAYYREALVGGLVLAALALIVYSVRMQALKTPHQRELDRIYRMHDGIIIRASRPANLHGKNIIMVESFDDLLNLEEELKVPIIAVPAGDSATQFIVVYENVAYVYMLGQAPEPEEVVPTDVIESTPTPELPVPAQSPEHTRHTSGPVHHKPKPVKKRSTKVILK